MRHLQGSAGPVRLEPAALGLPGRGGQCLAPRAGEGDCTAGHAEGPGLSLQGVGRAAAGVRAFAADTCHPGLRPWARARALKGRRGSGEPEGWLPTALTPSPRLSPSQCPRHPELALPSSPKAHSLPAHVGTALLAGHTQLRHPLAGRPWGRSLPAPRHIRGIQRREASG